ncbi:MAG: GntR family transcriptional regulator [Actinomycetota bacterium]
MTLSNSRRLPTRVSLAEDVYAVIVDMLMGHEMEPGQPFNIESFARDLGISPTPVREALARAESEGLVTKQQQRGFTVASLLTRQEAGQMAEIRMLLEPWAAARAATVATEDDKKTLVELATVQPPTDAALAYRQDMQRDADFHDAIWELAGNHFIRESLVRMHCHLHMYRLFYSNELRGFAQREHDVVARAIEAGDPVGAAQAMKDHIEISFDRLGELASSWKSG